MSTPRDDLRTRLSQILRSRPSAITISTPERPRTPTSARPSAPPAPPARPRPVPRSRRLEEILPGSEVETSHGPCWKGVWSLDERVLDAGDLERRLGADPHRALFLDLETTGFAGTTLFLAGVMESGEASAAGSPTAVRLVLLFARDYTEEAAVVGEVADRVARCGRIVTFNGKSYDWPFLKDRAARHRIRMPQPPEHVDLLHAARRRYRDILPDCRLQTLESYIGRASRIGDIPGSEIPARYHDAVRRGDPSALTNVFLHNARDVVTLAHLYLLIGNESS